ncbi:metal-dependent phosphohydrolase, partial [Bacillus cereus]|nr:metal-dependent phosphohydrolase [Bacillus cereus]
AREDTPTVYIKQGEVLVKKGEIITQEIYTLLDENELLKDKINYWPQFGLLMLSMMLALGLFMYIRQFQSRTRNFKYNNAQLLMLVLIFVITVGARMLISILQ